VDKRRVQQQISAQVQIAEIAKKLRFAGSYPIPPHILSQMQPHFEQIRRTLQKYSVD
jgi:hypothetical protein